MGFAHWLRENSEHYLLIDAQRRVAARHGLPAPPPATGLRDKFWLGVFAPTYRRLPWKLRRKTIQLMPGSHRQTWTQPPRRGTPAVGPVVVAPSAANDPEQSPQKPS